MRFNEMKNKQLFAMFITILSLSLGGCLAGSGGGGDEESSEDGVSQASQGNTGGTTPIPTPTTPITPPPTPDPEVIAQAVVNVGVMNFDQINATFAVLTGMDPDRNNIRNMFEDVKTSLPLDNNVKNFSATAQSSVVKLAAEYCFEAIRNNRATINGSGLGGREFVASGFNFNQRPDQVDATERALLVKRILDNFWQRDPAAAPTADDSELENLYLLLVAGEDNNANSTRAAAVGICASALSNANVLMM